MARTPARPDGATWNRLPLGGGSFFVPERRGRRGARARWDQAIAMEEFAEPMTFTTRAPRGRGRAIDTKLKRGQTPISGEVGPARVGDGRVRQHVHERRLA